jgi:hypothetical protein
MAPDRFKDLWRGNRSLTQKPAAFALL